MANIFTFALEKFISTYDLFMHTDCCFPVQITKSPRGLGLSVSGGIDSNAAFPGLIRIKRLFPHQVAWSTGLLQQGDILLEANGVPLTGLTNYVRSGFYFSVNIVFFFNFYFFFSIGGPRSTSDHTRCGSIERMPSA